MAVAFDFALPEFGVCFWHSGYFAVGVVVPEATVHEYNSSIFPQYYVGRSGKSLVVCAIAESSCKKSLAKLNFGLRVFRADFRHYVGAFLGAEDVGHGVVSMFHVSGFMGYARF